MDSFPRDMLMAKFVLCVHVVIWSVFHYPAIGSRSMPRYTLFF